MAFKMKGYSAYDKVDSAYDKHGAYKQKENIKIEEKSTIKKNETSPGKIDNINELLKNLGHNYDTIYNMMSGDDGQGGVVADWGNQFDDFDILNYAKKNKK